MKKVHTPLPKIAFSGILAGWWVGLAVILVCAMAGGVPAEYHTAWPMLTKLIDSRLSFIVLSSSKNAPFPKKNFLYGQMQNG